MEDVYEVADVFFNYSAAGIPLETMWTYIDYINSSKSLHTRSRPVPFGDSARAKLVAHLHENNQHYIMIVDPAVAYQTILH